MNIRWLSWLTLCLAPMLAAQPHTAPWTAFGPGSSPTDALVARVDTNGMLRTVFPRSSLPLDNQVWGGTVDIDNATSIAIISSTVYPAAMLFIDPSGSVQKSLAISPAMPGAGYLQDIVLDDDGTFLVVRGPGNTVPAALLRVSRSGSVTTVFSSAAVPRPRSIVLDGDTGDYYLAESLSRRLVQVSRDGGGVTSLGTWPTSFWHERISYQIRTGMILHPEFVGAGPFSIWQMTPGGTVSTYVTIPSSLAILDVRPDRSSARSERMFATTHQLSGTFYLIDDASRSVTSLRSGGAPGQSLVPPREVASCRTAPGQWEFRLHFEGQPKQPFAMAFSLAGMRPGMVLSDGRKILLQPDVLTYLSLSGRLDPVLTGNLGVLDPDGRAVVLLDLQNAPSLTGFNLFGLAVTLDPSAPVGLRTIADPIRIRL